MEHPVTQSTRGRCLGLIGGLGVGAAIHYYRELAKAHEARGSEMWLVMADADMPRAVAHVRGGQRIELAHYLAELIGKLRDGGAELAVVSAMTPHICFDDLAGISTL